MSDARTFSNALKPVKRRSSGTSTVLPKLRMVSSLSATRASARLIPGLILFGHLRFQTFEIVLLLERAYYSEADKQRVGVPPNALGKLRVLLAPFASGGAARGRTQACGVIVP